MINPPPVDSSVDDSGEVRRGWKEWFQHTFAHSKYKGSGTTANRPTNGLTVGDWYYDSTLGLPIWVHSIGPVVWHKADGAVP